MLGEAAIRIGAFVGVLAALGLGETLLPRRRLARPRFWRWLNNIGISSVSTLAARLAVPLAPVALAAVCAERGWGLFHLLGLPGWVSFLLAVAALDLAVYWQHRAFHAWLPLWRIHRMHHADVDFDATTGIRFHPIEIAASLVYKLGLVLALGPSPAAVLTFEVLLNACSMFNHANMRLPLGLDRILRLVLVTPDMHRVHHSTIPSETHANFGFEFPWWDRIFKTYVPQPRDGHTDMKIGLNILRDERYSRLDQLLLIPFS